MGLKHTCDSCGKTVAGIFEALKKVNGQYLCKDCLNLRRGGTRIPKGVKCPFCENNQLIPGKKFTTAGIITVLTGVLFVPFWGLGIILILLAFTKMRYVSYRCTNCKKIF